MLVEVALPLPLPRTFTYRVPGGALPGTRVRVVFGKRRLNGVIVGPGATSGEELKNIRDVDALLEPSPSITQDILELCRWLSEYYVLPLGQVLKTAIP